MLPPNASNGLPYNKMDISMPMDTIIQSYRAETTTIPHKQESFSLDNFDAELLFNSFTKNMFENGTHRKNTTIKQYDAFQLSIWYLNLYFTPVIIIVGLVGNLLSFLVFTFTHVQRLSASIFLSSLAVADILFLLALSIAWLDRQLGIPVFVTEGCCQIVVYITHFAGFMAVWNVLGFTAERYIVAYHPLKKDILCTRRKVIITEGALTVFAFVFYSYVLWTYDVIRFANHKACSPLWIYHDINSVLTIIDTLIACLIPSVAIVILNIKIIIKIHKYQSKCAKSQTEFMQRLYSRNCSMVHTSISTSGSLHIKFGTNPVKELNDDIAIAKPQSNLQKDQAILNPDMIHCQAMVRGRSQFHTARMLLVISSVFVLLNLPYHIFQVHSFLGHLIGVGPKAPKDKIVWHELFQLLYFLNFAINFFIYSACGHQFRVGLKRLARKWKRKIYTCEKEINKMGRNGNLRFQQADDIILNRLNT